MRNFTKIRIVGVAVIHVDRRRKTTMAVVAFRNCFAKVPKLNEIFWTCFTLNIEAVSCSGTFVIYASHIPEHRDLNIHCGQNFSFQNVLKDVYTPTEPG
jgi:hypothetical protein